MMSPVDNNHASEIASIIGCNDFLFNLKLLDLAPAIASPEERQTFLDGEFRPVVSVPTWPRMDITSYPSLTELVIDLMASISFFYAEEDVTRKYRIAANMVIAIGRLKNLGVGDSILHHRELHAWTVAFFSEEFSGRSGLSSSNLARCNVNMETLRDLGEKFGCSRLYVWTPVYDPVGPSLKDRTDVCAIQRVPIVNSIAPLHPNRGGSALPKPGSKLALVVDWYRCQNLQCQGTSAAVTALMKRYCFLRDEGIWFCALVHDAPSPMFASLENGGRMTLYGRQRQPWVKVEAADYYSVEAFFGDVMYAVCWLFAAPGEYEKRVRLAALLDCLARHWPADNAEIAALWEEMMLWMWKFIDVGCLNLNDRHQCLVYLERCDKYLKEFQQLFVSRTSVRGPLNIWTTIYLPPKTVWRRRVTNALGADCGTVANPLFKDPKLRTAMYVQAKGFADPTPVGSSLSPEKVEVARDGASGCSGPSTCKKAILMSGSHPDSLEDSKEKGAPSPAGNNDDTEPLHVPPPPSLRSYMATKAVRSDGVGASTPDQTPSTASGQREKRTSEDQVHHATLRLEETCRKENSRGSEEKKPCEASVSQTAPTPVSQSRNSSDIRSSRPPVSRINLAVQECVTTVSVKQETVDVVELPRLPAEDGTGTIGDNGGQKNLDDGCEARNSEHETNVDLSQGEEHAAPMEACEPPSSDANASGGHEDRKRRLDENLGFDFQGRIGSVQALIRPFRDHFPRHSAQFDALDKYVTRLQESTARAELRRVVTELLNDCCLENVMGLFDGFLKKFSALVDLPVKDEMETCLDALTLVLDDCRMLVDFQVQYEKKQRCQ